MVLGFAVVALFMVAVVSTIVATVNEMKKPPRPDPDASPMAPPLALLLPGDPNVTVFDAKKFADHEKLQNGEIEGYESHPYLSEDTPPYDPQSDPNGPFEEVEYENEPIEEGGEAASPAFSTEKDKKKKHPLAYAIPIYHPNQGQNPYVIPPFPSNGYVTGGTGFSSGGAKPPDAANKAFIPFFGYVDPVVLIAIVAFPVLCTLGITSLMMPLIPILIYIVGLIFPSSRTGIGPPNKNNTNKFGPPNLKQVISSPISPKVITRLLRVLDRALNTKF